jgi:Fe-S-cluster containining protein
VWVTADEIARLAAHLGLDVAEFTERHVRSVGRKKSLVEYSNGDCVFFDNEARRCTVYEARPNQCRTWPFWDSNLKTPGAWRETCRVCPGCGVGTLHDLEHIETQRKIVRV